jgi:hypothetical protein
MRRDELIERDGFSRLGRDGGEDAIAEQWIGQGEARGIKKSRKA